jgi:glutamate-1-semialdehyde 2,1-aminomutase
LQRRRRHTHHHIYTIICAHMFTISNSTFSVRKTSSLSCGATTRCRSSRSRAAVRVVAAAGPVAHPILNTTRSAEIFKAAQDILPGGVNSPVRAFKSVGGAPIIFERVKDAYAFDVDGNKYVDYVGSWGPAICGHANERVNAKLKAQIDKGTSFGAPCELENILGQMVIDTVPSVEMVRFCNSGTEACLSVLRVMRAYTKRDKIIKFEGCYHGHADPFLVKAGSGVITLGLPDSPGVPAAATNTTLCATYNNLDEVKALFEEHKGEIAGVILEPVVGNSGFIVPDREFLQGLRRVTEENGALLCFDEVMTGFRIAKGCAQEYWGVTPDLTTMGKVIGGGMPVGAYGGRRDIMNLVAPAGPMYQAGTLSGNPLAMTAGIETLKILAEPGQYEYLDKITGRLVQGILKAGRDNGHAVCGGHISGMFGFFFQEGPVKNFTDAAKSDTEKFGRWHRAMLEEGVYLAPSQFEAGFTSLAHTEADIDATIAAAQRAMARI